MVLSLKKINVIFPPLLMEQKPGTSTKKLTFKLREAQKKTHERVIPDMTTKQQIEHKKN